MSKRIRDHVESKNVDYPFVLETSNYASIYTPGVRPALELAENVAFVLNVARLVPEQPLTLAPGHVIRKASKGEIAALKDVCKDYGAQSWTAWECNKLKDGKYEGLPEDQWRHYVICFSGSNATLVHIERVLSIVPSDVRLGPIVMKWRKSTRHPVVIFDPGRLFNSLRSVSAEELTFVDITVADVDDIKKLHNQLRDYKHETISIQNTTQQLLDLEALSYESPLPFLGYFAILESLLTHQPRKTDTIDSITRQIVKKVILLDNRWNPRIDYSPFPGAKAETIWTTMYGYRSSLAHGGTPDFKNEFQSLGDHRVALKLLKWTVKGVLRQALIEPQLIADLRNC